MSSTVETPLDVRPFRVDIPDEALEDLRRRLAATRWPGVQAASPVNAEVPIVCIAR